MPPVPFIGKNAPGWNRTINLGIKSPLLCQLSYGRNDSRISNSVGSQWLTSEAFCRGVSDRDRTGDLQGHNLAL
jgi:hypothetical protein